ncbi:glycosyltransferase [Opitutus terrae]|uniref:Glycosyl transferase group 1 n=1 Tax=Opitutus terrae (strain DSM 11246 / JCM 15787 / PB90-1) TaxID=452637 RepID=B1ZZU5_OPITP|nr:glycosyltransferase [Opitutus terrae]ACB77281.1 glycosyl transferase group 1 [Opitutus terrae PB90-1]
MFLLDLSHTSHSTARTGIQRVARSLHAALGDQAQAVCFDPWLDAWRGLERWEFARLDSRAAPATRRSARWPWIAQWRGRYRRRFGRGAAALPPSEGLIVPEVFSANVAAALPTLFAQTSGPRVAMFHDALPLRFPEFTAPGTVSRFPYYLRELLDFDGIVAVSEDSRAALLGYWRWLQVPQPPPVLALPHGVEPPAARVSVTRTPRTRPGVLSVGTIEGRKNHLALLAACEQLWRAGADFELQLIGFVARQSGTEVQQRIRTLQSAGRPLRFTGPVSDELLEAAYADCDFTVYPSIAEGFGLPVVESLVRGRPCVCSAHGAVGELTRDGGCVGLDVLDASGLAAAIGRLLAAPAELEALSAAARQRTFKTWADYTRELLAWMRTLPRR